MLLLEKKIKSIYTTHMLRRPNDVSSIDGWAVMATIECALLKRIHWEETIQLTGEFNTCMEAIQFINYYRKKRKLYEADNHRIR
jgi:hypothetical protein